MGKKKRQQAIVGLVPVVLFTPAELGLFLDAIDLLKVVASVKVEAGLDVSSLEGYAQDTRQKIALAKSQVGGMAALDGNDYVILNAALLLFLQVVQLMPDMLSEHYVDRLLTKQRIIALQRKIQPYVQPSGKHHTHD